MADETVLDSPEIEVTDAPVEEVEQPGGELSDLPEEQEEEVTEDDDLDTPDVEEEEGKKEEPEQPVADGRKMPDGLKKAIAGLKETSPEIAKQIKGLYWSDQEYRAAFPKPADAVAAKQFLEEIGGQEGVQEIAAEREEWQQIDRDFSEGKPEFVKSLAEGNPEAFLKTAPHVINEFAQRAPDQYQYYANRLAINTMANAGLTIPNLAAAYERYKESNPEAAAILAEVHNSLFDLNQKASEFESKRTDPREEQLKQREQEFETKRRADFETGVASQAEKYLSDKMQTELDRVIAGRKVDPEAMRGYQKLVKDRVGELLEAVPGIADKLEAYYRTGDAKKSLDYIQSQYNRLLPQAAKVVEPFLRNIAPGKPQQAQKTANGKPTTTSSSPGSIVLREMPDYSQIDFDKCTVAEVMMGKAVLKNGKTATGWA